LPRWGKLLPSNITRDDVKRLKAAIKAPIVANQTLAAASAIFSWALREEVAGVTLNPCRHVERHATHSRERVLAASEVAKFWAAFSQADQAGVALKLILLTGQRPGEIIHLRRQHICDGWWEMPGRPDPALGWPGTKNGESHRVWLPAPAQQLLAALESEFPRNLRLTAPMRALCAQLKVSETVRPHDLRRTHGTLITGLGFGRDAMNRIQNHKDGGIGSVYDRHQYADENKRVMEAVAAEIVRLAEGRPKDGKVVALRTKTRE
jgi:integrase